ncbi:MAG: Fic family protein [Chitinivibrionales bacterium]|nr:Fic family protein [Chitinivibrionales bacterium]
MQPADFSERSNRALVKTPQDYWAFVPGPLPPALDLSWDLVVLNSRADRALSELAGVTRTLPNPHLLIGPFARREAVLSSRIEGTNASLSDLFYFEASHEIENRMPDVREVRNYVRALEHGLRRQSELPICMRLIREMHGVLMEGVRGETQDPGQFRRTQNWIGSPGCTLMEATYVPPPVAEMAECLSALEKFIHARPNLPLLVRLALVHYQFEAIHPFLDGNGRIGRLLITLLLCAENAIPGPVLYLSAFFERYRDEYYQRLLDVSRRGRWTEWIMYFLRAVETQSRKAISKSRRLLELQERYRAAVQTARSSALTSRLVDLLFISPIISAPWLAATLSITPRAAQQNIDKLIQAGILTEITGRRRNRMYAAQEILATMERAED